MLQRSNRYRGRLAGQAGAGGDRHGRRAMRKTRTPQMPKPARGRRATQPLAVGAKKKLVAAKATPTSAPPAPVVAAAEPATRDYGHGAFAAMIRSGALLAEGMEGIGRAWVGVA